MSLPHRRRAAFRATLESPARAGLSDERWLRALRSDRRRQLLRLSQVLMRGAVTVVRQWHPLAGRALAGAGTALQRIPVDVEPVLRLVGEKLVRELQVALDHAEHPALGVQREVSADVVE